MNRLARGQPVVPLRSRMCISVKRVSLGKGEVKVKVKVKVKFKVTREQAKKAQRKSRRIDLPI